MREIKHVGAPLLTAVVAAFSMSAMAAQEASTTTPDASTQGTPPAVIQAPQALPGAGTSDASITSQVSAELAKDPQLKSANIQVATVQGKVALKGSTPSAEVRARAEQVATSVQGVTSVDNQLTVGNS